MAERVTKKVSPAEAEEMLDESVDVQARAEEVREVGQAAVESADDFIDEVDSLLDDSEELRNYRQQGGE